VITSINYNESPDSGDALYVDLQIEQVTFAYLKKTEIPQDVQVSLQKKAASKSTKSKADSKATDVGEANGSNPGPDVDPLRTIRD
jgi:hypothetical protein